MEWQDLRALKSTEQAVFESEVVMRKRLEEGILGNQKKELTELAGKVGSVD